MKYFFQVLKKYTDFKGRSSRKEHWMFFLITALITMSLHAVDQYFIGIHVNIENIFSLADFFSLGVLIPSIAVCVRRMHDVNKNGIFCIIPFYGLYLACKMGTKGVNRYGEEPVQI